MFNSQFVNFKIKTKNKKQKSPLYHDDGDWLSMDIDEICMGMERSCLVENIFKDPQYIFESQDNCIEKLASIDFLLKTKKRYETYLLYIRVFNGDDEWTIELLLKDYLSSNFTNPTYEDICTQVCKIKMIDMLLMKYVEL